MIMITPEQFGATGDGSDQTAAMQLWAAGVAKGGVGYLPGHYGISAPLRFANNAQVVIGGDSYLASSITLLSTTQDGLVFTGSGRFHLHDFAIFPLGAQTNGAAINVPGKRDSYVACQIERIWMPNQIYKGIASTGMSTFTIRDCDIAGLYPFSFKDPGDSIIAAGRSEPLLNGVGISCNGDCGGLKVIGHKMNGSNYSAAASLILESSDGDVQFLGGSYEGWNQSGAVVDSRPNVSFNNISFIGVQMAGVGRSIYFPNSAKQIRTGRVVIGFCIMQDTLGCYIDGVDSLVDVGNIMSNPLGKGPRCGANANKLNWDLVAGTA
jgi:hypothetical protein